VITGVGLVTPLGCGTSTNWDRLVRGESGIDAIQRFDASMITAQVAGEVRDFDPERSSPARTSGAWTGSSSTASRRR
jgi:3-oxoacyl-[acyl-carrier-protein] synthase II